ncbi:phosphotransferase family protein [Streptomyces anulatus]|uniref:phosphotransferase family protein n=1 Tax=Streptomyces anulatus TaxID=1892 RepID=UPI00386A80A8
MSALRLGRVADDAFCGSVAPITDLPQAARELVAELRRCGPAALPAGERLTGGFLHDVRRVTLADGSQVVVKRIGRRSEASGERRFRLGESVARAALSSSVPAVPAYFIEAGDPILRIGDTELLIYPNIPGTVLSTAEHAVDPGLCLRAGELLSRIHRMRLPRRPFVAAGETALWDTTVDVPWARLIRALRRRAGSRLTAVDAALLTHWSEAYAAVLPRLSRRVSVGHGDLAPRNVIVHEQGDAIIDWEHAGLTEPWTELAVLALDWSSDPGGQVRGPAFLAAVHGYVRNGSVGPPDADALVGRAGRLLAWSLYNAQLALRDTTGPHLQRVETTVQLLHVQAESMVELTEWFIQAS